jgi:hypothetical protein
MEDSSEVLSSTENDKKTYKYDAIVVLGAMMEWNKKTNSWEFPTIIDRYPGKLVEGKARAIATREIQDLASTILVTGGSDINPETGQTNSRAVELSRLITERYKVPKGKVVPIGTQTKGDTQGNVDNVIEYLKRHPDLLTRKKIAILSPRFQKERAEIMFNQNPYFNQNQIDIEWLIVEDILGIRHPLYKKWEKKVYNTEAASINRQMEQKGIADLKAGEYKQSK